jgi:hypothetical protein
MNAMRCDLASSYALYFVVLHAINIHKLFIHVNPTVLFLWLLEMTMLWSSEKLLGVVQLHLLLLRPQVFASNITLPGPIWHIVCTFRPLLYMMYRFTSLMSEL